MDVLCDTSFLMALVSAPVKLLDKVEAEVGVLVFLVPSIVVAELERLEKRTGPKRSHIARMARKISTSKFRLIELSKAGHVDEAILEYAKVSKCVVATLDRSLRDKLLDANTPVISLSSNRLIIAYPTK
jgi:rRNA-processing protein FCF1